MLCTRRRGLPRATTLPVVRAVIQANLTAHFIITTPGYFERMQSSGKSSSGSDTVLLAHFSAPTRSRLPIGCGWAPSTQYPIERWRLDQVAWSTNMNSFNVTNYNVQIHAGANNPAPFDAFIGLNLVSTGGPTPAQAVAFLNFHADTTPSLPDNSMNIQGGMKAYNAHFHQRWFAAAIDLLRNELPISFWFDEATKEAILGTGTSEPVGEKEN